MLLAAAAAAVDANSGGPESDCGKLRIVLASQSFDGWLEVREDEDKWLLQKRTLREFSWENIYFPDFASACRVEYISG